MGECNYGRAIKVEYYNFHEKDYVNYECPNDTILDLPYCKFHSRQYAANNPNDIVKSFYSLLYSSQIDNVPLLCIGFSLFADIIIDGIKFGNDLYFSYTTFGGSVSILKTDFNNIDFSSAKFGRETDFTNVNFGGSADFSRALFKGKIDFTNVNFGGSADFSNTTFIDNTKFTNANFKEANFSNATFIDNTKFIDIAFVDIARFSKSIFRGSLRFLYGDFRELADFSNAWFEEGAFFDSVNFANLADFTSTISRTAKREDLLQSFKLPIKPDITILIRKHASEYEVILDSAERSYERMGTFQFEGDPRERFLTLLKDVENHRNHINDTIQSNGQTLYQELLPDKIKEYYWKIRDRIKSVQILSDEPWIPWEIIKPWRKLDNGEIQTDDFLCERFALSRWIMGKEKNRKDRIREAKIIVPIGTRLKYAEDECKWIEDTGKGINMNVSRDSSEEEVRYTLKKGKYDLIHFCTHGRLADDPIYSTIELEDGGKIRPVDIIGENMGFGGAHPLVFMNACGTGVQDFFLTGIQSWVIRMLDSGVSAFIGTLWSVSDEAAIKFTKSLYGQLIDGHSLGEAVRIARNSCKSAGGVNDASWLAYVLYGEPNATLTIGQKRLL